MFWSNISIFAVLFNIVCMSCPILFDDENINISCKPYKAKTESLEFTEETCLYYSELDDTYYARSCDIGKICTPKDKSLQSNYTCVLNPAPAAPAYPGEACSESSDCNTNNCVNGICIGKQLNQPCESDGDCAPGLHCDDVTKKCIKLLGLQTACIRDAQCDYSYYCQIKPGSSAGQCAEYFDISDDEEVDSCISPSEFDYKCKSGSCGAVNNGVYKCYSKYRRTYPTLDCTSDFDCIVPNTPYTSTCNCGYSRTGTAYCKTLVGDDPYVNFNKYYKNWLSSGKAKDCNTMRRGELSCMSKHWDVESYNALAFFYFQIQYWDNIKDADEEVIKTFYPDYLNAKKNYEVAFNLNCPSYKCKTDSQKFDDDTCGYYDKEDDTYYIDVCESGKVCTAGTTLYSNYTCISDGNSKKTLAYPGEKCDDKSDCYSDSCKDSKCKGKEESETCKADTDCDPELYCDSGTKTCRKLRAINKSCLKDWECDYGTFCYVPLGYNDGKCTSYFSLTSGTQLNSCKGEVIDYQCETGFCLIDDNDPVLGPIYTCSQTFSLKIDPKEPCSNNFDCIGFNQDESESLLYSKCDCSYSQSGEAYCELLPGDEVYAKYIYYNMKWHNSTKEANCNTARRNTLECIEDYWNEEDFYSLQYYMYKTLYWPKIQDVESCTKKIFAIEYWEAKEDYDEYYDDHSFILQYTAFLALIILII